MQTLKFTKNRGIMKKLMSALVEMGPILPGTLVTTQRPLKEGDRRRRKDAGTIHMLSYNVKGRNSSMYVKREDYAAVAKMVANYSQARALFFEIGLETVSACRQDGVEAVAEAWHSQMKNIEHKASAGKVAARPSKVLERSRDTWKNKAKERQAELEKNRITTRDLSASRDKWRTEALGLRKATAGMQEKARRLELAGCKKK